METNAETKMKKNTGLEPGVLRLVVSAVMLGLSTALSLVKLFPMPMGGSVTLCSMLPVMLVAYKHGPKWGLGVGFAYGLVQLFLDLGVALSWGMSPTALAASFVLDYILAFMALGLAGMYGHGMKKFIAGLSTAVGVRFVCHVISGVTVYAATVPEEWQGRGAFLYSLAYNGSFLLPDFAICLAAGLLIYKPLKKYLEQA